MSRTIKQNLEDGIKSKDWKLVIAAYEGLTGEKLTVPDESDHIFNMKNRSQQPKRLIIPDDDIEENPDRVVAKTEDFTKSPRFNMFVDDGKEASSDRKMDKLLKPDYLSQKGGRPAFKLVKVTCSRCKKSFEGHVEESNGFICAKCSRGMDN